MVIQECNAGSYCSFDSQAPIELTEDIRESKRLQLVAGVAKTSPRLQAALGKNGIDRILRESGYITIDRIPSDSGYMTVKRLNQQADKFPDTFNQLLTKKGDPKAAFV